MRGRNHPRQQISRHANADGGGFEAVLVVAHEACAGDALFAEIRERTDEGSEVLVLAPALTKRLHPDGIVIVTDPSGEKNWLEHEVVAEARNRCALPISHLVVTTDEHAVVIPSGPGDGRAVERHRHPTPPFS